MSSGKVAVVHSASLAPNMRIVGSAIGIACLAVAIALPFIGASRYTVSIGINILAFAVLATGLNLVYGCLGLLSLAQVGFWGIGAYATALLVVDLGWNFVSALFAGAVITTMVSLLVGYASLRLSRHSFAIVTLSFALLAQLIARDWTSLTRGPTGIAGLPSPQIGGFVINSAERFYVLMLLATAVCLAVSWRLMKSRIGGAWRAIKQNEPLAQSQGLNTMAYKLLAFSFSAFISSIAGGIFVFYLTLVDPSVLDFYYTEASLIMVIVGGPGSFWGVVGASVVFTIVPELLRTAADLRMIIYGVFLIAAMLAFPDGIGGVLRRRELRRRRWRPVADASVS